MAKRGKFKEDKCSYEGGCHNSFHAQVNGKPYCSTHWAGAKQKSATKEMESRIKAQQVLVDVMEKALLLSTDSKIRDTLDRIQALEKKNYPSLLKGPLLEVLRVSEKTDIWVEAVRELRQRKSNLLDTQ